MCRHDQLVDSCDRGKVPAYHPGKEKGEFMRKGIARRCLCIALASAMVFGDVGIASAAESSQTDAKEVVSTAADDGAAETAASEAYVSYLNLQEGYNQEIKVYGSAYAYKAELWVNGKLYSEQTSGGDNKYIDLNTGIDALAGTTYTVEVRVSNQDGEVVTEKKQITTSTVSLRRYEDNGELAITAESQGWTTSENGIRRPDSVYVYMPVDNPKNYSIKYEVYRSTKPSGGYSRIAYGNITSAYKVSYYDYDVKAGTAYYYKLRILRGTDEYVTSDKVLSVSGAAVGVRHGVPTCTLSSYTYGLNNGKRAGIGLSIGTNFANQYDIYRSTARAKGYKKIASIYENYYEDKSAKKGTVYYYKAVPKYYDSATGKTITGKFTEPVAARYIMDAAWPELTQVATTSLKCEWDGDNSSDVSYEVWYRRTDIIGDAYRKAAVTKKKSFVLKNLAPNGKYSVKIRTVKKAGSAVKYSDSNTNIRTMGYTDYVQDLSKTAVKSAADTSKGIVAVYYKLTWYKDWGASGYYVKAYNNYTGKTETIRKLSAKAVSYTFRNVADTKNGLKYSFVKVVPYRGKVVGEERGEVVDEMPAVSRVKVTRKSGTSVQIDWTSVPGTEIYAVYRITPLGVSQTIGYTSATSFVDTHVTNGLKYTYSVRPWESIAGFYQGYYKEYADYTHALTRPAISSGTNASAGTASLKWNKIANAKCYKVYRAESVNGKYVQVARTSQNVMVYADKKLKKGKTYYYRVVALTVNDCGKTVKSTPSAAKAVRISK